MISVLFFQNLTFSLRLTFKSTWVFQRLGFSSHSWVMGNFKRVTTGSAGKQNMKLVLPTIEYLSIKELPPSLGPAVS